MVAALVRELGSYFAVGTLRRDLEPLDDQAGRRHRPRSGSPSRRSAWRRGHLAVAGRWSDRHVPCRSSCRARSGWSLAGTCNRRSRPRSWSSGGHLRRCRGRAFSVRPSTRWSAAERRPDARPPRRVSSGRPARSARWWPSGRRDAFARDVHLPFYTFVVVILASLAVGLAIARNSLRLPEPVASGGEVTAST